MGECACECTMQFWCKINYCTKPNPNPNHNDHSGSWIHNGLGDWSPRITLEYGLAAAISIWALDQPVTCEMCSSTFVAMTQLKVPITTSSSLPIIPYTERTKRRKIYHLVVTDLPMFIIIEFLPTWQQLIHSDWLSRIHVIISEPDVDNLFHLALP